MPILLSPSDRSLRAADRLVLVDPNDPIFYRPIYIRFVQRSGGTLEIPVDSRNPAVVDQWRDRIGKLNLEE
ncbi:MAG TPA: hypothetical protein VM165_24715 [Planctomycetaceae bacterium]|nr:hypothetical protein [Planctomycetaceae bacterium]